MVTPIDQEAAAAFAAATTRLREVTAALASAEASILGADARLSLSAGHTMRAKADAVLAESRADAVAADLATANDLLSTAHLSVEGSARRSYQDGAGGAWSTVLAAKNARELANLATDLQTVSDTRGHAFGLLAELPRQIDSLEEVHADAKVASRVARGEWKAAEASYDRLAHLISTARASIEPLRKDLAAATAAATAAIPADQALSVERRQESDRLATDIVAASSALEASGGVVAGTGTFSRPATGVITSDYGWRMHPILGYQKLHNGIDYDGADGVVYAADDGVVILTVWSASYGNVTVIDHGRSGGKYFATFYAHQAGYFVDEGDVVRKGQSIGAVGSTGLSTGPHLHFEVRLNGVPVDPRPFL